MNLYNSSFIEFYLFISKTSLVLTFFNLNKTVIPLKFKWKRFDCLLYIDTYVVLYSHTGTRTLKRCWIVREVYSLFTQNYYTQLGEFILKLHSRIPKKKMWEMCETCGEMW